MRHFMILLIGIGLLAINAVAALPDGVWIHYSGEMRGALDPCGCKIPMGGITRRMGVDEKMRKIASSDAHFMVDAGEWRDLSDPVDGDAKSAALLKALKLGPLAAVNVSLRDLMFGHSFCDSMMYVDSIPFVSANLRIDSIQAPLYPAFRIAKGKVMNREFSIGFVGLTDPSLTRMSNRRNGIIALDWTLVLRDVLNELTKERVDAVVLLTDASPSRLDTLLMGAPPIPLIISSNAEWPWSKVTLNHRGYVASPMPLAKRWEAVRSMGSGSQPWTMSVTELVASEPESQQALDLVTAAKKSFKRPPPPPNPNLPPLHELPPEMMQPAKPAKPVNQQPVGK